MSVAELHTEILTDDSKALWIFAYGSLCWRPGFEFHKAVIGYVRGYQRRFWQGNNTHRGTQEQGEVHGIAFAISGEAAIPYLSQRECKLGGYISHFINFYPMNGEPFKVLVYVATPNNPHWLGQADVKTIARQILHCKGANGFNVEYILRLANFMRDHFSDQYDIHLFELEKEVLALIQHHGLCLKMLMGSGEGCISFIKKAVDCTSTTHQLQEEQEITDTFQFTMRLHGTKLRCLNL